MHDHPHDHGHAGHHHDDDRAAAPAPREPLERGAGHGKLLFFDAPSGLAGDMIVAALLDLGVPLRAIEEPLAALALGGFHLHISTKVRSGIVATSFDVHVEGGQPERSYRDVRTLVERAKLPDGVRGRALATFRALAEAEARVHRSAVDDVHFHEVGAVDAIVDVVASAAALDYVGATIDVSPLPMGRGYVHARHGRIPLPAPAVVEVLRGLETYDGGIDFEFVTPTGAAICAAHARRSTRWPALVPERAGWGAGRAELADRPNLLRVVLGIEAASNSQRAATHAVLEANVDDATGELLGACIEALLEAGAVDAWAAPITMKKGRPAATLGALVPLAAADAVAGTLLRESTSIGLRRHDVSRVERPRETVDVETRYGRLPVKIARGDFGPPQLKPEFDACREAARAHCVPVRAVVTEALLAAWRSLG